MQNLRIGKENGNDSTLRGHKKVGLDAAFPARRTRFIVLTLWPIRDDVAQTFMGCSCPQLFSAVSGVRANRSAIDLLRGGEGEETQPSKPSASRNIGVNHSDMQNPSGDDEMHPHSCGSTPMLWLDMNL